MNERHQGCGHSSDEGSIAHVLYYPVVVIISHLSGNHGDETSTEKKPWVHHEDSLVVSEHENESSSSRASGSEVAEGVLDALLDKWAEESHLHVWCSHHSLFVTNVRKVSQTGKCCASNSQS